VSDVDEDENWLRQCSEVGDSDQDTIIEEVCPQSPDGLPRHGVANVTNASFKDNPQIENDPVECLVQNPLETNNSLPQTGHNAVEQRGQHAREVVISQGGQEQVPTIRCTVSDTSQFLPPPAKRQRVIMDGADETEASSDIPSPMKKPAGALPTQNPLDGKPTPRNGIPQPKSVSGDDDCWGQRLSLDRARAASTSLRGSSRGQRRSSSSRMLFSSAEVYASRAKKRDQMRFADIVSNCREVELISPPKHKWNT
jgi:hypothetical protein